jgi:putative transcriptional regulator
MALTKFSLDPKRPPQLYAAEAARLDTMTSAEIEAGAGSDPDNPPLTSTELTSMAGSRMAKAARQAAGLSQSNFAAAYRINVARLRDLEQGRTTRPDSALVAYLTVIAREPEAVSRALAVMS